MISIKKFLVAVGVVLMFASIGAAQEEGSVQTALSLVGDFDAMAKSELSGVKSDSRVEGYLTAAEKKRDKAIADIKALRWSEAPSAKRFNRLYRMYDNYAGSMLDDLKTLARDFSGAAGLTTIDNALARLTALRKKSLDELKQSSRYHQKPGPDSRIVPVIDRSPYDDTPGSQKGLWER
jgi:hypothetical protein